MDMEEVTVAVPLRSLSAQVVPPEWSGRPQPITQPTRRLSIILQEVVVCLLEGPVLLLVASDFLFIIFFCDIVSL